jgi:DNA-binding response OmpR family regulator
MRRLLIVDDDEAMRRLFRLNLSDNYEIVDTDDPEQALALAMEHKPDAILMDLRMPKHSGLGLCRALGAINKAQPVPIFIVSGETASEVKQSCKEMGTAGFFEKPVDFDALRVSLDKVKRQMQVPRAEVRVQIRVELNLSGTDSKGREFKESTFTENVSVSSFLCALDATLANDSIVEVFIARANGQGVGKARVMRSEERQGAPSLYAFRFTEKTGEWILQ